MTPAATVERQGDEIVVRIAMQLKRRLGRREVIVPDGATTPMARPQPPLVLAVARAYAWQGLLESGRYGSLGELAAALGMDRCYVRRILGLACLAPDIVEATVEGKEPSGLSLERLTKEIPVPWAEQRQAFGLRRTP